MVHNPGGDCYYLGGGTTQGIRLTVISLEGHTLVLWAKMSCSHALHLTLKSNMLHLKNGPLEKGDPFLETTGKLICSLFSRENGHLLLICSSLSTSQTIIFRFHSFNLQSVPSASWIGRVDTVAFWKSWVSFLKGWQICQISGAHPKQEWIFSGSGNVWNKKSNGTCSCKPSARESSPIADYHQQTATSTEYQSNILGTFEHLILNAPIKHKKTSSAIGFARESYSSIWSTTPTYVSGTSVPNLIYGRFLSRIPMRFLSLNHPLRWAWLRLLQNCPEM